MQPLSAPDFGSAPQSPVSQPHPELASASASELPDEAEQLGLPSKTALRRIWPWVGPSLAATAILLWFLRTWLFAILLLFGSTGWQEWAIHELSKEDPIPWRIAGLGLRSGSTDLRVRSVALLGKAGPEAAPALVYALDAHEVIVATLAESKLLELGPQVAPALVAGLKQSDPELERDRLSGAYSFNNSRARACTNILTHFGPQAAESLLAGLEDASRSTRFWCLTALVDCEPQSLAENASELVAASRPSLRDPIDAIRSKSWIFVEQMALSLPQAAGRPLFELISEVLEKPGPGRAEACHCLAKIARISIYENPACDLSHLLAKIILEDSSSDSWPAVEALSNLRSTNELCAQQLIQGLRHQDPRRKSLAAKALSRLNNPPKSSSEALQEAISQETDRLVRIELESAAARLKHRK
jgi:HEAT repeat protein